MSRAIDFSVDKIPSNSYAYTNCIYANESDFVSLVNLCPRGVTTKEQIQESGLNVWVNTKFVLAVKPLREMGPKAIGMGAMQRMCLNLANSQMCSLTPWVPDVAQGFAIATVHFEVQQVLRAGNAQINFDCEAVKSNFEKLYVHQAFAAGQLIVIDVDGAPVKLSCTKVELLAPPDAPPATNVNPLVPTVGLFVKGSSLVFTKAKDAPIKLVNQGATAGGGNRIFKPDFDFSKLGIGGLDKEFNDIFRRAFASRVFPPSVIEKMGIKHVRGMLLFGPPGCGKTLIARQIGRVLNAKEPKVVNGPEILDKFVGESERKIRELFADARREQDEMGESSELHIIIFDEIDAICKARGSSRDGTGVGDSVVNQLLTQIDGVDSLNNVLVIGMTNRKDMLDEALMRPGRLEVQMEINLPDEKGRAQILTIHTQRARDNGFLDAAVVADLEHCRAPVPKEYINLAQRTKNFSGAEIEGLVRAATAHALSRGTDGKTFHAAQNYIPQLTMADFDLALTEIKPKFGAPQDTLELFYRAGLHSYGQEFETVKSTLNALIHQVKTNENTPLMSCLLHGEPGSGKTALAAACAVASEYPLVRMIKASDLIGRQEGAKCGHIYTVFEEAYRSPLSMIILDDIERLLEYVALGPRFSNPVLQALMVLIKNPVPVLGRKLLVVGITSNYSDMKMLGLPSVFDVSLEVPLLSSPPQFDAVLLGAQVNISADERARVVELLGQKPMGVKKLLLISEMARQESDGSSTTIISYQRFVDCLYKFGF
ncbi:Aste57867_10656 [Aphanomyces stellatus]|uniref:Vesicle-fusing ATPase n=1 Tax=Aphanomyces stellatus TaxID=120398 RepID=A0A485KS09_9STRA|nr:hypothetical protein As57867_010616 [Aphanomyces stellatus]VFT87528.1 Aste57867_10656 [Aphanomyces stellatus]